MLKIALGWVAAESAMLRTAVLRPTGSFGFDKCDDKELAANPSDDVRKYKKCENWDRVKVQQCCASCRSVSSSLAWGYLKDARFCKWPKRSFFCHADM